MKSSTQVKNVSGQDGTEGDSLPAAPDRVRRGKMPRAVRCGIGLMAALAAWNLNAASATPEPLRTDDNLSALSIEELIQVEVISVARKDQQLLKTPAAVYVITADDIRRSGVTSVPELLRMAPGIEVAQITSAAWAVSARGFNGRSANKILVLIDGRSAYNSLYSGTIWDQNQVPLENIERIEVIRGPGATMWGANAVDGVISVITKKAKDTQGFLVSTEVGQNDLPDSNVRYGGHAGDHLQYRMYAGFAEHLGQVDGAGLNASDRWNSVQGGGRADWQISDRDSLTIDGAMYRGSGHQRQNPIYPLPSPLTAVVAADFNGGFALARWERQLTNSDFALEAAYTREAGFEWLPNVALDTIDLDFQHHRPLGRRHDFNWGGGYRFRRDSLNAIVQHPKYSENLFSVFVQDEVSLVPARLALTGGVKIQNFRNTSGNNFEIQPQARLLWTPGKVSAIWTSVSRAVRTPSQLERDFDFSFALPGQNGLPVSGQLSGNPALPGEVVLAYEAGYRHQFSRRRISIDAAGFYNHYSRLIASAALAPELIFSPQPRIVVPETYISGGGANTHGIEIATSWSPLRQLRFRGSYARETAAFPAVASSAIIQPPGALWATPKNVYSGRASWDATRRWSVDSSVYGASSIPSQLVPGYVRVDLRVARRFAEGGEFSVGVRNLFDEKHLEFRSEDFLTASYLRRNAYAKFVWRF